jgi:UDP-N-acetylmuramoyl-tripeptide--D-alanyl-D-alanine ligase
MMMAQTAARVLHAEWCGEDVLFTGVSTDSRSVKSGDLFIALSGKNFDGHKFVAQAKDRGAVAAMVNQESDISKNQDSKIPMIIVKDTLLGLGRLAAYWRGCFDIPLIAVTGSNGKTTVKEMIASILLQLVGKDSNKVLATTGNLNNDIGVPKMLLQLCKQHKYAVIEMGMNHSGEISYLTHLAKPGVALITNAGAAHIEGIGSVEAVARAKGEIFEGLGKLGIAVINADDPNVQLWHKLAGSRPVIEFGLSKEVKVGGCYQLNLTDTKMKLKLPDGTIEVKLRVPGKHNVYNALAAAAASTAIGISKENIASGLGLFGGVDGRLQQKKCQHDATMIDDSYNANPESVRAALSVLANSPGKKILILGDMGELGDNTVDFHESIGEEARLIGIDRLFTLGELSAHSVKKFGVGAQHFKNIEDLIAAVEAVLAPNVTLLIKGSRFMRMERVVRKFEL